jgi:hypothetical protein
MALPDPCPESIEDIPQPSVSGVRLHRGRRRKWQVILGVALGFVVVALGVMWLLESQGIEVWPRDPDSWKTITYRSFVEEGGSSDLFYTRRVSEEDARRVGAFLQAVGYFDSARPVSVFLTRRPEGVVVAFFLEGNAFGNDQLVAAFEALRLRMSHEVFADQPVIVELCGAMVFVGSGLIERDVRQTLR